MSAAHFQLRAVVQDDQAAAAKQIFQPPHAAQVNHSRTMYARKLFRVEPRLYAAQVAAQQVRPLARVNPGVVADGFEPINFLHGDEVNLAARFDEESSEWSRGHRRRPLGVETVAAPVMFEQR